MNIAVSGSIGGGRFAVVQVLVYNRSVQEMQRMRASGQLDCGKWQTRPQLDFYALHETTRKRLIGADLASQVDKNPDGTPVYALFYIGPEACREAKDAAELIEREERAVGRDVSFVRIDPMIPCVG
jgi:hypothetical protein